MGTLLVETNIKLNVQRPNSGVVVYAKQYDMASRVINIDLLSGSEVWDPPSENCEMVVMFAKPDGTIGIYDVVQNYPQYSNELTYNIGDRVIHSGDCYACSTAISTPENWNSSHWNSLGAVTRAVERVDTGKLRLTLAEQALTVAGNVWVEISFYSSMQRITTLSFVVAVETGVPKNEDLASDNYFNILSELIQGVYGAAANPPIIDYNSENWMLWDTASGAYVNSEFPARGDPGPAPTIKSNTIRYVSSSSGTTIPSSTASWQSTVPSVSQGDFLWTRTQVKYGTGNGDVTVTSYSVARQGIDGSGSPGNSSPRPLGSASPGSSTSFSRQDHVHETPFDLGSKFYTDDIDYDPNDTLAGSWTYDQNVSYQFETEDFDTLYEDALVVSTIDIVLAAAGTSIAAMAGNSGTIDPTSGGNNVSGYTPVAIAGFGIYGSTSVMATRAMFDSAEVGATGLISYAWRNVTTSAQGVPAPAKNDTIGIHFYIQVLWRKSQPDLSNRKRIYCWTRTS